jgi:hypothetical protein
MQIDLFNAGFQYEGQIKSHSLLKSQNQKLISIDISNKKLDSLHI